jgi:hypothetical protein
MFKFVLLKPSLLQLIVMMKSTIIHFKQFPIAAWSLALPKKNTIDPWRLAMLGIGSVRPDN